MQQPFGLQKEKTVLNLSTKKNSLGGLQKKILSLEKQMLINLKVTPWWGKSVHTLVHRIHQKQVFFIFSKIQKIIRKPLFRNF